MTEPATVRCVDFGLLGYSRAIVPVSAAWRLGLPSESFVVQMILKKGASIGEGGRARTVTRKLREDLNQLVAQFMPTRQHIMLRVRTAEFAEQHYRCGDKSVIGSGAMYLIVPDYCVGEFYDGLAEVFFGFFPKALD